jgi:hypothetical protein
MLLATVALSGSHASYTTSSLPVGTHSITAVYSGDTTFQSETSAVFQESVGQLTPSIALVSSVNPTILTSAVTFTASVSAASGTPTGSVAFYNGSTRMGSVALAGLSASYTTSNLPVGTNNITAAYSGDNNFSTVTSAPVAELV